MRQSGAQGTDSERGQVSVEFLGTLPAVLLVALVGWQLLLAGHAAWLAGNAARVAARAEAVGRDPVVAARGALPSYLREDLEVAQGDGGRRLNVRLRIPFLLERWRSPLEIRGSAAMQPQAQ
jgi:pilus assembly protein CpaE